MPQGLALLLRQAALLMLWKLLLAPAPTAPATSALADSCNKLAAVGGLVVCQFVGGVLGVQVGDRTCSLRRPTLRSVSPHTTIYVSSWAAC